MTVVVIGSGPTGTAAAWQLLQRGAKVVMLEAGGGPLLGLQVRCQGRELCRTTPAADWLLRHYPRFENLGDPLARWVQLQASGGMANVWGGVVLRAAPCDFEPPPDGDERHRWPFGYSDLEPWYQRVERLLWIRGSRIGVTTLPASLVKEALSLDPLFSPLANAAADQGRALLPLPYVDGPPDRLLPCASPRQAMWPLLQLMLRRGLRLIRHATVTRIVPHPVQSRVQAVDYIDASATLRRIETDAVVLAAGSLASPKLLLQSACPGFPDGLGNSHGLVGRYLHDNPLSYIHAVVDRPLPYLDGSSGGLYLTRRDHQEGRPCGYQIYSGWAARFHANLRLGVRDQMTMSHADREGSAMVFSCYTTQTPSSRLGLRLHPSACDRHGLPLLRLDASFGAEEHQALADGLESVREMLVATGWDHQIVRTEIQPPGASVHWGGAARMHQDARFGVVDGFNQCHEVPNLLIVDASCFTNCLEKNPTLTAMAIAMRAADSLAARATRVGNAA